MTVETIVVVLLAFVLGALPSGLFFALRSRQAMREQNVQLGQQQEQIHQLQTTRAQLQETVQSQTAQAAQLQQEREQLISDRARLQASEDSRQQQIQDLNTRLQQAEQQAAQERSGAQALKLELTELNTRHKEKILALEELQQSLEQARAAMRLEFQQLAQQVLEEKGKAFSHANQASLDQLLKPFREQIESFKKRVNEVHDASVRGQTSLGMEIRQVREIGLRMSAEANTLASALKGNKKATGNWGEMQLERSLQLAGLVRGTHYESQASFTNTEGRRMHPDFVIKLPDGKHMVIDSKVSLVDYDRAIGAEAEAEQEASLKAHVQAVRNHIDDLSRKDYSNLLGMRSPSFVLMFMPIEPAYIEAMKHNRDLFDYGYQRNVVMVSHTTLMPILRTVANLWMVATSNEQARELSDMAGDLYNQVALVGERAHRLGNSLRTVGKQYNDLVTGLAGRQGLYGKVERFAELSTRANREMKALEQQPVDLHVERLQTIEWQNLQAVAVTPETDQSTEASTTDSGVADKIAVPVATADAPASSDEHMPSAVGTARAGDIKAETDKALNETMNRHADAALPAEAAAASTSTDTEDQDDD